MAKVKNLIGITDKKGAMADVLIKDGYVFAGNPYMVARVPLKVEQTENGVYKKGYFSKPIVTINEGVITYNDETQSPKLEVANLGVDYYPPVEKVLDKVKSANRMTVNVQYLKKMLGVFAEQGIAFVTLAVPDEADLPLTLSAVLDYEAEQPGKEVKAVIMPINTTEKTN